ncbi:MAG: hydrogenase/urease maturation nickel metallochaperone HypA, partial [Planctomycetota bacterium]
PQTEPRVARTEFRIDIVPARFRCTPCGNEFSLADTDGPANEDESEAIHFVPELAHAILRCPGCNSPDFEVTAGRGVHILRIAGDTT